MEFKVKIHTIKKTEQKSEKFKVRNFVIFDDSNSQYPQFIEFQATQDRCMILDNFRAGDMVTVSFNLKGRLWTSKEGEEKCFNSIESWKIVKQGASNEAGTANSGNTAKPEYYDDSSLPF